MKKNNGRILIIIFTILIMVFFVYLVINGNMLTQDETKEKVDKALIKRLND